MGEVTKVEINTPTETENITLEQEAEMQEAAANNEEGVVEETPSQGEEATEDRPEWLDSKFGSPEDLAKAYEELEKKQSESANKEEEETVAAPEDDNSAAVNKATLEFEEKGELSPDTFKSLEEVGLPKAYVEAYIAGQEALKHQQASEIQDSVGGKEQYEGMVSWAAENLSEEEVDTFNTLISTGTPEQQKLSIKGLHAQYLGATGPGPALKQGSTSGNAVKPFSSTKELERAMRDKRYQEVPSYRAEVEKRLAVSSIL